MKQFKIGICILLMGSLFPIKSLLAQGKYWPKTIVCSNPNHSIKDTIQIEYDWANRITRIISKVGGHTGQENRFDTQISYNEDGFVASLNETPLGDGSNSRQKYRFGYRGVFLNNIWFDQGSGEEMALVQYSAPTNTYNVDYKGTWQNFVFEDGDLVASRIKGYEVFSIHRDKEARPGVLIHIKNHLPIRIVSQTLGASQLAWYVLANYQVDLLVLNDQNIFIETKRDEYGRIAQLNFVSDELGNFQTTTIEYKTVK
ncbi:MAG: hypothetical protein AAF039_14940 [Bacteroidota bacterium]